MDTGPPPPAYIDALLANQLRQVTHQFQQENAARERAIQDVTTDFQLRDRAHREALQDLSEQLASRGDRSEP